MYHMGQLKDYLRLIRRKVNQYTATVSESPIWVLGNQKSGTTAIAALLANYAGLSVTLDIDAFHDASVVEKIYDDPSQLEGFIASNTLAFSRELIKEPGFTFLYPALEELFPSGHFVMVVRDPRDNIRSILDRLELPGDQRYLDEDHIQDISPEWKQVLDGSWMGLEGETYIDMLAARWAAAVQVYLDSSDCIELIRYEDFCDNKKKVH